MSAFTAVVTGGNRGIGYETCRQLASLGMAASDPPQLRGNGGGAGTKDG